MPFSRNHLTKYVLNISEMQPESGKVECVVCKFYINWGKEENMAIMLQESKQNFFCIFILNYITKYKNNKMDLILQ